MNAHARCCRRQTWNRLGDTRKNRRTARNGRYSRARSTARRICILARPSGRRSPVRRNPDVRNRASESEQRRELLDASAQLQDLLSELRLREVATVQTDHDCRRRAQPATRRRAGDAEVRGDGDVAGAVDEMSKPVVVALLRAGRGRHGPDHRPFAHAAQLTRGRWGMSVGVTTTRAGKSRMSVGIVSRTCSRSAMLYQR